MRRRRQEQSGGAGSTNYQAGRDIVQSGISASEARAIALDIYKSNALELRGIAESIVADRVESLTYKLANRLQQSPQLLSSMGDPDMLSVVFAAQEGFARSGEEDLEAALVDLLVDRAGQQQRDLKTLVLNGAIETLPKLTSLQRKALAVCFLFGHVSYGELESLDQFYSTMAQWKPILDIGAIKRADLQYMEAAGVGSLGMSTPLLGMTFAGNMRGFYTRGFNRDDIPDVLRSLKDDQEVFVRCLRNSEKLQVNAVSARRVAELQDRKSIQDNVLENFANVGVMDPAAIEAEIVERIPDAAPVVERWMNSGLTSFQLTAAGIAIGHAYWKQVVPPDASAPLDIWLSE
jgi:hypothetical protein